MSRRLTLRAEGRALELELRLRLPHATLVRDGSAFEAVVRREGDRIEIQGPERTVRCAVVVRGARVWVAHEGRTYVLERVHRDAPARGGPVEADEIRAPMTGRVVSVEAREGAGAREGDLLLVIEAMKMEFRLTAPEDGNVTEVLCSEGDRVELGQVLVRLEPAGAQPGAGAPSGAGTGAPA